MGGRFKQVKLRPCLTFSHGNRLYLSYILDFSRSFLLKIKTDSSVLVGAGEGVGGGEWSV